MLECVEVEMPAKKTHNIFLRKETCRYCGRTTNRGRFLQLCGKRGFKCRYKMYQHKKRTTWSYISPRFIAAQEEANKK